MDFMNNIIKKFTKNIWHDIYIRKLLLLEGQIDIYYDYGLFDNEYTGREYSTLTEPLILQHGATIIPVARAMSSTN